MTTWTFPTTRTALQQPGGPRACSLRRVRGPQPCGHPHQGSGLHRRRAQQPIDRLWPGRGPGRHRRPDHPDALHHPGLGQLPAAAGHHAHRHLIGPVANEECGRRIGHYPVAGLCPAWPVARYQCLVAGQCQIPQGRHPDCHAAQGCRWRGLCIGTGQLDCGGRRCLGGRQQSHRSTICRLGASPMGPRSSVQCPRLCKRAPASA